MNNTNFKQYNTAWAKLGYPKAPHYIKDCGCGEVAIANAIIEMQKYANENPKTIQPYCKQYAAANGDGTYWSAPPKMMAHYGMTEVQEHQTMNPLWKELAKGGRVAIYLMSNRKAGSKGIKWTGTKHFICSTDYRYDAKTGKHWVYVKDSNSTSASRNGWISYEDYLRNAVFKVWSGKLNGQLYTATPIKDDAKLAVDGVGGINTVRHLQKYLGVTMTDGITIREDLQKYVPALTAYEYGNGSPTVTALQKWLGLSNPDGLWGANTSKALQKKLGVSQDGIFGENSMKALQKYLNDHFGEKAVYPTVKETIIDKELAACKVQADWMRNAKYAWESNPTIEKSKKKGTCVTFVACVLQRIGLVASGKYVWHDEKGKVYGDTSKLTITYYSGKTLSQIKGSLKAGDIVMDGNKNDSGSGSHIFILTGRWSGNYPIVWDNHSAQDGKGAYTYTRNRNIIAVARPK